MKHFILVIQSLTSLVLVQIFVILVNYCVTFIWDVSFLSIFHWHVDIISILGLLHVEWRISVVESFILSVVVTDGLDLGFNSVDWSNSLILGVKDLWDVTLKLLFFWLDVLNSEGDNSSSDLNGHGVMSFQSQLVFEQNYGTKFRCIVFNIESIRLALDDSVASTDTDVIYPNLTLVTSSKLELCLFWSYC